MASFSAVLLVGGASKRMGRDKALLEIPGSNLLLWQRQWRVLEELQPEEIFWSGPRRPAMPAKCRVVADVVERAGPLGGISACLGLLRSDLLVVLAVDLPAMNADFLRRLLARCSDKRGAVARHGDFFEPLAAVYPRRLNTLAAEHLAQGRCAMQDFIREAIKLDALDVTPLEQKDVPLFKNLNTPSDI
jgi:molybdopterin-guanine dinucleotide biosynthesis protein A